MGPAARFSLLSAIWLATFLLWAIPSSGQSTQFVKITPEKVTLLIGESRTFHVVNQNGQMQHDISWSLSDRGAFQVEEGDELVVTAKESGDFTVSAHNPYGSAEASIKVMEGSSLPMGTVKWSGPTIEGCTTSKVIPAVPSASGADVFVQSVCADGEYIQAFTSDGNELWRHKIGAGGAPPIAEVRKNGVQSAVPNTSRLNPRATSACDLTTLGTDQQKVRELLNQHNLSISGGLTGEGAWVVEQSGTECKLWFDAKLILIKKQKIFVSE
jgi:hypothetical protein